ncbi:hypothetical protein L3i22_105520 [Actinoplanes sp. L3-i22]|nr:hypothetical protein L3i22_105520 [Actinoplanes sp. L3-i22]
MPEQLHDGVMGWDGLSAEQRARWITVLDHLGSALDSPPGVASRLVLVDGTDERAGLLADRLAGRLRELGRPCVRLPGSSCVSDRDGWPARANGTLVIVDGPHWRAEPVPWQLSIWVRTPPARKNGHHGYRGDGAGAVIDLHDPGWPVLRHIEPWLLPGDWWYRSESQAFFAARAATWDTKFGADMPAYAAAIREAGLVTGGVVADVGCGTGRAFPAIRDAIGPYGKILGLDLTPQMLAEARPRARECAADLLLADARRLPVARARVDAVFAAGLVNHLPDPVSGLAELARITRPGGKLVLFHPSGRAALAARHGRELRPDEPLAEDVLRESSARAGWALTGYDDSPHRFHAVAVRQ